MFSFLKIIKKLPTKKSSTVAVPTKNRAVLWQESRLHWWHMMLPSNCGKLPHNKSEYWLTFDTAGFIEQKCLRGLKTVRA